MILAKRITIHLYFLRSVLVDRVIVNLFKINSQPDQNLAKSFTWPATRSEPELLKLETKDKNWFTISCNYGKNINNYTFLISIIYFMRKKEHIKTHSYSNFASETIYWTFFTRFVIIRKWPALIETQSKTIWVNLTTRTASVRIKSDYPTRCRTKIRL